MEISLKDGESLIPSANPQVTPASKTLDEQSLEAPLSRKSVGRIKDDIPRCLDLPNVGDFAKQAS